MTDPQHHPGLLANANARIARLEERNEEKTSELGRLQDELRRERARADEAERMASGIPQLDAWRADLEKRLEAAEQRCRELQAVVDQAHALIDAWDEWYPVVDGQHPDDDPKFPLVASCMHELNERLSLLQESGTEALRSIRDAAEQRCREMQAACLDAACALGLLMPSTQRDAIIEGLRAAARRP